MNEFLNELLYMFIALMALTCAVVGPIIILAFIGYLCGKMDDRKRIKHTNMPGHRNPPPPPPNRHLNHN